MVAEPYAVLARERLGAFGRVKGLTPAMAGFAVVAGVAWANGGYFPTTWGWASLALLGAAMAALAVPARITLARADRLFLGALAAFLGWIAASVLWSESVPRTMLEVERGLVYLSAALVLVLVARRESVGLLLGGALAGITAVAVYALATRLLPERLGSYDPLAGYRLAEPVGYWNGLGVLCSMGALLALGLAARGGHAHVRALAAAPLPLLLTALFFTFSRGAWIALGAGLAAMLVVCGDRLRLAATVAVLAPASALAILIASQSHALTREGAVLSEASREGQGLVPTLALLVILSFASLTGLVCLQRRIRLRRHARRRVGIAVAVATLCVAGVAVATAGGPGSVAHRASSGFTAPPAKDTDLNRRVLSLSSNGRAALWSTAWQDAREHPLLGSGAGTYEGYFYEHRNTAALNVRDAHSLYLEALAELGPVGLVLLLAALALPFAAALRSRGDGLATAATGAYAAYLVHAAWDWDWELPTVTLTALLVGVALLARARRSVSKPLSSRARLALAAALVVPAAFAALAITGNRATAAAQKEAAAGNWTAAAADARQASRLAPWASDPLRTLAQTRMADGDFAGAETTLRAALRKDPRNWALWLDLALATDGPAHQQALDRARALNPLNPDLPTT